ncbi:MAG TPA: 2-C-methyl-D-erythritol 2,4-cyclodiphosphate synthase [Methylococcaceae bacterium]|nr:2-C-methyl-D-erythritol 2,4-cyclodiphosphate synthase [Methylococcaceae bacterium]
MLRIGQGYDVHRFNDGNEIILGGVKIPYERGLEAHSDGDVVLHALCDALLGALAMGDIGKHFPDTDAQFKGADSRVLLRHVYGLVKEKQYRLGNADITIIAQAPKMLPYTEKMCRNIAEDLGVQREQINVKATTTEKLGFEGRKEGIAVQAIVLLTKHHE